MYDTVLVPTDGSDDAKAALGHAADIADRYGATVHVVCVVDPGNLERLPAEEDSRLRWAEERIEETMDTLPGAEVPTESAVEVGVVHETILAYAAENDVDLVAMGTRGRTGLERYLLGSVAERVVRLADAPVLTVGATDGGASYPYRDVLVPTDGSEGAAAAYGHGVDLAATYGATLHAVSVVDERALPRVDPDPVRERLEERAESAVAALEDAAAARGVGAIRPAVVSGVPHRALVGYVEDHGVDAVVMGTHGRSGLERYLLGSVAEKLVRTSPVPVMTVRAPEEG